MKRKRLLLMLALLVTATTGTWAQSATHKVTMKDGTEDQTAWTIEPAAATSTGIAKESEVIATYSGSKTVKSVMAVFKATSTVAWTNTDNGIATKTSINLGGVQLTGTTLQTDTYFTWTDGTFTNRYNEKFTRIEIDAIQISTEPSGWTASGDHPDTKITWSGTPSESVSFSGAMIGGLAQIRFTIENSGPSFINLTPNADRTAWTLASTPDADAELEVTYYTDEELAAMHTVNLNDGELNPTTWTASLDATNFGPLPIKATAGETVTLSYSGTGEVKRITAVTGALTGKFTVSAEGKKVVFSQGNLQAVFAEAGSNCTWQFAANQWDCVGNAAANTSINGNGTVSAPGTVDLFGWVGKSNTTWEGAAIYGISNDATAAHYGNTYPDELKSDWGNTMGNGWFTLTAAEWNYLINRPYEGNNDWRKFGFGRIGNVKGLILIPDSWMLPDGLSFTYSKTVWSDGSNSYTTAEWAKMEAAGAVFLPAAGYRTGSTVDNVGYWGFYMSSSAAGDASNYALRFREAEETPVHPAESWVHKNGYSVRLVRQTK